MKLPLLLFSTMFLLLIREGSNNKLYANNPGTACPNIINRAAKDTPTYFGVMVAKTEEKFMPLDKQIQVARLLGVNYVRGRIDLKAWDGSNAAYDKYVSAGLKVILNINYGIPRNAAGEQEPVYFPTDMDAYKIKLSNVLNTYKPELVVIENEEDNPLYHLGSAEDYIAELKTAIEVAHSKRLKITNGGLTVREVCLIIYDDYLTHGQQQKAKDFASRAFPEVFLKRLYDTANKQMAQKIEFGRKVMEAYKTLDLDFVNFHWYEPVAARYVKGATDSINFDAGVFATVANYLKTVTKKPVITNEFGVFNTSPILTRSLLQVAYDSKLNYAIFYSADGGTGKAVALQNADGYLRPNGLAFQNFIKQLRQ